VREENEYSRFSTDGGLELPIKMVIMKNKVTRLGFATIMKS
jgi:hypothetical protein